MRAALIILGLISLALWLYGYAYVHGLACAFATPTGDCTMAAPWTLRGEDLVMLVVLPALVSSALFGLAFWLGRRT